MNKTILYAGEQQELISLGEALLRQEQAEENGQHLAIISAQQHGGKKDEYFLVLSQMVLES